MYTQQKEYTLEFTSKYSVCSAWHVLSIW